MIHLSFSIHYPQALRFYDLEFFGFLHGVILTSVYQHGLAHGSLHGLIFLLLFLNTIWLTVFSTAWIGLLFSHHGLAHGFSTDLDFLFLFFLHGLAYGLPSRAWILIVGLSSRDHSAWSSPGLHRSAWITRSGLRQSADFTSVLFCMGFTAIYSLHRLSLSVWSTLTGCGSLFTVNLLIECLTAHLSLWVHLCDSSWLHC